MGLKLNISKTYLKNSHFKNISKTLPDKEREIKCQQKLYVGHHIFMSFPVCYDDTMIDDT